MKKILVASILLVLAVIVIACSPTGPTEDPDDNTPTSVSLDVLSTPYAVGTHTLSATVLPALVDQSVVFSLVGTYEDVSLTDNILTIESTVLDGLKVSIRAVSTINPLVRDTKVITVTNPTPPPTEISTETQLREMSLRGNYILVNDIELTEPWIPLGVPENEDTGETGQGFTGTLDGNGYKITNFNTAPGGYNKGFFYLIENTGIIKNLGFESGYDIEEGVKAQAWSAVVAGSNKGLISNVYTNVRMETVGVPGASLVGSNYGTIEHTFSIGPVIIGEGSHGSGLVNSTGTGTITSSFVLDTTVTSAIGYNRQQNPDIQKSDNWMKTKQNYIDAGFSEDIWYIVDGMFPVLKNPNFVAPTPEVFVLITNTESYLNYNEPSERELQITYSIANATNNEVLIELLGDTTGITLTETGLIILSADVVDGQEFSVRVSSIEDPTKFDQKTFVVNNPDGSSYVEIYSINDLTNLANSNNPADLLKNYRLMNDIDLGSAWWNVAIAKSSETGFNGIFDGNGYSLLNFAGGDAQNKFGIFHHIGEYGIVRNLNIELRSQRMYVGSESAVLAHQNDGLIENVFVRGELMSTASTLAGLVYNNTGTIQHIISLVILMPNESLTTRGLLGGIAFTNTGTITNTYVDKTVTGVESLTGSANTLLDQFVVTTTFLQNELSEELFDQNVWHFESGMYPSLKKGIYVEPVSTIYIKTESELRALTDNPTQQTLNLTYVLMNDIYLTEEVLGEGNYWTKPIGNDTIRFNGIFDGNGFTIYNVKNNSSYTASGFGFFGTIGENGIVRNLILDTNGILHVGTNSAVFAQYNYGIIENTMTFGEIRNTVGTRWISGFIRVNNGIIRNSIASVIISHSDGSSIRGAFTLDTASSGTFENAIYNTEIAGSSTMPGLTTGVVKFFPSGSNNTYIVDYNTAYFTTAANFSTWDSNIWQITDGEYITLKTNITA